MGIAPGATARVVVESCFARRVSWGVYTYEGIRGAAERMTWRNGGLRRSNPRRISHSRRRGGGGFGQGGEGGVGGALGGVDAVGDADAVEGDPGEDQPGVPGGLAPDRLDAVEVAERVLGHRAGVAADLDQERLAAGAQQVGQLGPDDRPDRLVVAVEQLGLGRAADEDPHQHRARRGRPGTSRSGTRPPGSTGSRSPARPRRSRRAGARPGRGGRRC